MISVVIPALNEEKTIAKVVRKALQCHEVSEVIVVDDHSADDTVNRAEKAGARIIMSKTRGKGISMREGMEVAKNEVLVFLDADIPNYGDDVTERLARPVLDDKADFVKSYFQRQAGRVTELVAKPLLSIMLPGFPYFRQPLSGMIAGRKSMLEKVQFEEGYGVDIGILIDMYQAGARIEEVDIGEIENRMQSLDQLGKMSKEVARTIMKKSRNIEIQNLVTLENIQIVREQMNSVIMESLVQLQKIAIFDMDNTLIRKSFIQVAADEFGMRDALTDIRSNNSNPLIRTKLIARLLKGKSIAELLNIVDSIETTANIKSALATFKDRGYITGIITDSYDFIALHLKQKFGFDFILANDLEFSRGIATGEVRIPSYFLPWENSICKHDYCKTHALLSACDQFKVDLNNTFVVGDGANDICMVKNAGIGVSFCSHNELLGMVADYHISEPDFMHLHELIV